MDANRCVCCGEIIPEGRMVCWQCEHSIDNKEGNNNIKSERMVNSPTEKQIRIVDFIAELLGIDFPQSSDEFTEEIYEDFINDNLDQAMKVADEINRKDEK